MNKTIKELYYQDGNNVICLLIEDKQVVARGIAICSAYDVFSFEQGKEDSKKRALEARGRKSNCQPILLPYESDIREFGVAPVVIRSHETDLFTLSLVVDRFGGYKGYYNPTLTTTEKLFLSRQIKPVKNVREIEYKRRVSKMFPCLDPKLGEEMIKQFVENK